MKIRNLATTGLVLYSLLISCDKEDVKTLPALSTMEISAITDSSAHCGGIISSDGNADIIEKGVCWSSSTMEPTIGDTNISDGEGGDTFTSLVIGLEPRTTYFLRAYATNSVGTAYGNTLFFKTSSVELKVSTLQISLIMHNSAQCGGLIDPEGNPLVAARGVCWDLESNPDLSNNHSNDGAGYGEYISNILDLEPNTTYYTRAYATNSDGYTSYGADSTFRTLASPPELTTISVDSITQTTARSGGWITSDGGDTILSRGVCYGQFEKPTINDIVTNDGSGKGEFISNISGLNMDTWYHIRAYAINSQGTIAYGEEHVFRTLEETESPATEIEYPDASINGQNVLASSLTTVIAEDQYSFAAKLSEDSELTIKMSGGSWYYRLSSIQNWSTSRYDRENKTQTFSSIAPGVDCDLELHFESGLITVEYFENGAETPTKTKTISVQ